MSCMYRKKIMNSIIRNTKVLLIEKKNRNLFLCACMREQMHYLDGSIIDASCMPYQMMKKKEFYFQFFFHSYCSYCRLSMLLLSVMFFFAISIMIEIKLNFLINNSVQFTKVQTEKNMYTKKMNEEGTQLLNIQS